MIEQIPDWLPFSCLITGKWPIRKPFVTRAIESVLTAGIAAGALPKPAGMSNWDYAVLLSRPRLGNAYASG